MLNLEDIILEIIYNNDNNWRIQKEEYLNSLFINNTNQLIEKIINDISCNLIKNDVTFKFIVLFLKNKLNINLWNETISYDIKLKLKNMLLNLLIKDSIFIINFSTILLAKIFFLNFMNKEEDDILKLILENMNYDSQLIRIASIKLFGYILDEFNDNNIKIVEFDDKTIFEGLVNCIKNSVDYELLIISLKNFQRNFLYYDYKFQNPQILDDLMNIFYDLTIKNNYNINLIIIQLLIEMIPHLFKNLNKYLIHFNPVLLKLFEENDESINNAIIEFYKEILIKEKETKEKKLEEFITQIGNVLYNILIKFKDNLHKNYYYLKNIIYIFKILSYNYDSLIEVYFYDIDKFWFSNNLNEVYFGLILLQVLSYNKSDKVYNYLLKNFEFIINYLFENNSFLSELIIDIWIDYIKSHKTIILNNYKFEEDLIRIFKIFNNINNYNHMVKFWIKLINKNAEVNNFLLIHNYRNYFNYFYDTLIENLNNNISTEFFENLFLILNEFIIYFDNYNEIHNLFFIIFKQQGFFSINNYHNIFFKKNFISLIGNLFNETKELNLKKIFTLKEIKDPFTELFYIIKDENSFYVENILLASKFINIVKNDLFELYYTNFKMFKILNIDEFKNFFIYWLFVLDINKYEVLYKLLIEHLFILLESNLDLNNKKNFLKIIMNVIIENLKIFDLNKLNNILIKITYDCLERTNIKFEYQLKEKVLIKIMKIIILLYKKLDLNEFKIFLNYIKNLISYIEESLKKNYYFSDNILYLKKYLNNIF